MRKMLPMLMAMMLATTGFANASDIKSVNGVAPNESYRNLLLELANNSSTEESSDSETEVPILVGSGTETIKDPSFLAGIPATLEWDQSAWETYKNFNELEKLHQEQGISPVDGITNPFHYAKTGDPFGRAAREWLYENGYIKPAENGKWDWVPVSKPDGSGFAYVDKYGYTHVSHNLISALVYSKDGLIYDYDSAHYSGGYALTDIRSNEGTYGILYLSTLEGSVPFTNNKRGDDTSSKKFNLFNIRNLFKGL